MKIEMHVKGTQQVVDFESGTQECFLLVEVFGEITRVACTEEQMQAALEEYTSGDDSPPPTDEEQDARPVVAAPSTFVGTAAPVAAVQGGQPRRLGRLRRGEAADDAGIPQG